MSRRHEGLRTAWWSAEFGAATGQAIVTSRVVGMLAGAGGQGVVYPSGGLRAVPGWLVAVLRLWGLALQGKVQQLYLVCSRSNGGLLRDLPAYLLGMFGSRIVVHTHGSDIVDLCRRPLVGRLARFFLSRSVLVLPSAHLIEPMRSLGVINTVCCENFFEPSASPAVAQGAADGQYLDGLSVLWNSNIMASKGFFILAEAVERLAHSGDQVRMRALGRCVGDEVLDGHSCAARLELLRQEPWLDYHGPVSRPESARLLERANLVCLPSTYASECQPLAMIEAMCAARPIIVANTPALRATVGSYPCLKVDVPIRVEILARAIIQCTEQVDVEALHQAAQSARERFSPQRFDYEMSGLLRLPGKNSREIK
jgi:glycosyltransferase involved in cell wall biosynthesis